MQTSKSPRIAIIGPGAIGATCAAALVLSGRPAPALCGPRQLPAPLIVELVGFPPITLAGEVMTSPERAAPADFVLLAVKAHQTAAAAAWLAATCRNSTTIVVLQNGVEHIEGVAPLAGDAAILPAIVHCRAERLTPAHIRASSPLHIQLPACAAADEVARLFAGGPARVEPVADFLTAQWRKLCLNAVAGLMAAAGRTVEVYRVDSVAELAQRLALECIHVGRACGADLPDGLAGEIVDRMRRAPAGQGTSILSDRLAGRPLEWDARNGVVQRFGRRHGIPTPVSDVLVPLLAACDPVRRE